MSTTLSTTAEGNGAPAPRTPDAAGADSRALRLNSILTSGLPADLGTPGAPALYTVPVVFSRQVTAAERELIEDPETARRLVEATGTDPGLVLAVDDRRLLIHNTSLRLLKEGLATAIGRMLQQMGRDLLAEQDRVREATELLQAGERERASAIARQAAEISFSATDEAPELADGETS